MNPSHYLVSSTSRRLPLRARTDLQISTTIFQGETSWIVKDPVALKYYRMREAEYEVLKRLDGTTSFADLQSELAERFPDKRLKNHQLQTLLESFHANGLVVSATAGQAIPLERRRRRAARQKATSTMRSLVSIRFPGVDPERFLTWLYPKFSWLFSVPAFVGGLMLMAGAMLLVLMNWSEFQSRLPDFHQFFGVDNLILMAVLLMATKTIHELGHGLACKHFGGECHQIGLMLLVLTPAMYCDTSDSWILPNKWHRIAIGAAGMWVELLLASACTFVWWYTHPGWIHFTCLNLMFLCGVSTVVFNINPLLRYDGYYMLSDFLEIPNLSRKANLSLLNQLRVHCLGMDPLKTKLPPQSQWAFAAFSVTSFFYRWFVLLLIFLFLAKVFQPFGLETLGYIAIAFSLFGMIVMPALMLLKYFHVPGRLSQVNRPRFALSMALAAGLLAAFFLVPLPHHVTADFVVTPVDAQQVFVDWPGVLSRAHVGYGDRVSEGDRLVQLENHDLDRTIAKLEMQRDSLRAILRSQRLEQSRLLPAAQSLQVARRSGEIRAELAGIERRLEVHEELRSRLTLVADRDGVLLPPPNTPSQPEHDIHLAKWSGLPLDPENASAFLSRKTLVGYVGDPTQMRAMLAIPQTERKFLRAGQSAALALSSLRGRRLQGAVHSVSRQPLEKLPRELSSTNGGPIPPAPGATDFEVPLHPTYEAAVELEPHEMDRLLPGMKGKARVHVGYRPAAEFVYRNLLSLFRFSDA